MNEEIYNKKGEYYHKIFTLFRDGYITEEEREKLLDKLEKLY